MKCKWVYRLSVNLYILSGFCFLLSTASLWLQITRLFKMADLAGSNSTMKSKTALKNRVNLWEQKVEEHKARQLVNPFSDWEGASQRKKLSKNDERYGRPVEGSKTEYRGKLAGHLISSEIIKLLEVIYNDGCHDECSRQQCISFGRLFELYTRISNKVVGILLRARKYQLVSFQGEMLYQRRDENTIVSLTEAGEQTLIEYARRCWHAW